MHLSKQNIDSSITFWEKKLKDAKTDVIEREKYISFMEGSLSVWMQIKSENQRATSKKRFDGFNSKRSY